MNRVQNLQTSELPDRGTAERATERGQAERAKVLQEQQRSCPKKTKYHDTRTAQRGNKVEAEKPINTLKPASQSLSLKGKEIQEDKDMKGYKELDKGKFEAQLVNDERWETVAYTDYDVIKVTRDYRGEDKEAVEEFAEQYDLPIAW